MKVFFSTLAILSLALVGLARAQVPVVGPSTFAFTTGGQSNIWTCNGGQSTFSLNVPTGFTGVLTVTVAHTSSGNYVNPPWAYAPGNPGYTNTITNSGSLTVNLGSTFYVKVADTTYTSGSVTVTGACSAAVGVIPPQVSPPPSGASGYVALYPSAVPSPLQSGYAGIAGTFVAGQMLGQVNAAAYGASTSAADNAPAFQNAIDAAEATNASVHCPVSSGEYVIKSTLLITQDNLLFSGLGSDWPIENAIAGRPSNLSPSCELKWGGSSGGTMIKIASASSSYQYIARGGIVGVGFDGNSDLAATAIEADGATGENFSYLSSVGGFSAQVIDCVGVDTGNTVGNCQSNTFQSDSFDQSQTSSGNCITLAGTSPTVTADAAYDTITDLTCTFHNGDGVYFGVSDGNSVHDFHGIGPVGGGSGYGVVFGCASVSNTVYWISAGGVKALGTTTCTGSGSTGPSTGNRIFGYDFNDNVNPIPVIETGASITIIADDGHIYLPNNSSQYLAWGAPGSRNVPATGSPYLLGSGSDLATGCIGTAQTCRFILYENGGASGAATAVFNSTGILQNYGPVTGGTTANATTISTVPPIFNAAGTAVSTAYHGSKFTCTFAAATSCALASTYWTAPAAFTTATSIDGCSIASGATDGVQFAFHQAGTQTGTFYASASNSDTVTGVCWGY